MTLRTCSRLPLASLLLGLVACCTPMECQPELLPHRGEPVDGQQLYEVAQYAAQQECDDALYTLLSARTQDEIGSLTFQLFWASFEVPEYDYELRDVIGAGTFVAVVPGPDPAQPDQEFAYVEYQEPGKENLLAQILIVREPDDEGVARARIALQDQADLIQAGDYRYYWDAGR